MKSHGCSRRSLALACLVVSVLACPTGPIFGQAEDRQWPDIKDPGMDLGDFPNSAFTIPAGTCQVEFTPFSFLGEDQYSSPQYFTQYLFRFGVTDSVEFRILGNGFTVVDSEPGMTGFSPVGLDTKVHLWDVKREWLVPAASLEVVLSTDWGTPVFCSGYQPSINLNFDFPISDTIALEWTVGYGEVLGLASVKSPTGGDEFIVDENVDQISFEWSVGKDVTEDVQVFVTGASVESIRGQSAGTTLACGGFWRWSDRLMYFGVLGWGVTPDAPELMAQVGLGIALGRPRSRPLD